MDTKLLEALYWKGVPVFDMGSHMSTIDVGWGSPTFHKMGREKVILIDSILPFGFELLMCDTDMVWLKVPSSLNTYFLFWTLPKLCLFVLFMSSDHLCLCYYKILCCGWLCWSSIKRTAAVFASWVKLYLNERRGTPFIVCKSHKYVIVWLAHTIMLYMYDLCI